METDKIGKFDFVVEKGQEDASGHLSLPVIVTKMLDCAGDHAEARGFGLSSLGDGERLSYTWVMSRLAYEIYEMPSSGERYSIVTWVENIYHQFTNRCFEIQNQEGKVIGYARSIWALIDFKTRKSIDLHALYGDDLLKYAHDRPCPIEGPARIRMTAPMLAAQIPVVQEDIDFNGHVNSVRYIEHILNLFSAGVNGLPKDGKIVRFDIAYVTESLMGDTLNYYTQQDAENLYSVELKNQDDKVICRFLLTTQLS